MSISLESSILIEVEKLLRVVLIVLGDSYGMDTSVNMALNIFDITILISDY